MAKKPQLATAASFLAVQVPNQVHLYALGNKPTPHTRVWLEVSLLTVFPPEYILRTNPPDMPDIQVITPFQAEVTFRAAELVKAVTVHDAAGPNKVRVNQAPPSFPNKPVASKKTAKKAAIDVFRK